jgi:hypothetical protein
MRDVLAQLRQLEPPYRGEVHPVLRRNEEVQIDHSYAATGQYLPRRGQPDGYKGLR